MGYRPLAKNSGDDPGSRQIQPVTRVKANYVIDEEDRGDLTACGSDADPDIASVNGRVHQNERSPAARGTSIRGKQNSISAGTGTGEATDRAILNDQCTAGKAGRDHAARVAGRTSIADAEIAKNNPCGRAGIDINRS